MSERLCGYCREPNHTFPKCPQVAEQRNLILTHTPKERLYLIKTLVKAGLGIGAMIKRQDMWDTEHIGLIDNFDWVSKCQFFDTKNIKYSKKIRLSPLTIDRDFTYRRIHMRYIGMGNGTAGHRNCGIPVSALLHPEQLKYTKLDFTVESPSDTMDFDPDILVKDILMPQRLRFRKDDDEYHRGVMPLEFVK